MKLFNFKAIVPIQIIFFFKKEAKELKGNYTRGGHTFYSRRIIAAATVNCYSPPPPLLLPHMTCPSAHTLVGGQTMRVGKGSFSTCLLYLPTCLPSLPRFLTVGRTVSARILAYVPPCYSLFKKDSRYCAYIFATRN